MPPTGQLAERCRLTPGAAIATLPAGAGGRDPLEDLAQLDVGALFHGAAMLTSFHRTRKGSPRRLPTASDADAESAPLAGASYD
jgi:hypothetical protein